MNAVRVAATGGRVIVERDGEAVLDMSVAQALQLARAIDKIVGPAAAINLLGD